MASVFVYPYTTELSLFIPASLHGLPAPSLCVEVLRRRTDFTLVPEPHVTWTAVDPVTADVQVHFLTNYPDHRRGIVRLSLSAPATHPHSDTPH